MGIKPFVLKPELIFVMTFDRCDDAFRPAVRLVPGRDLSCYSTNPRQMCVLSSTLPLSEVKHSQDAWAEVRLRLQKVPGRLPDRHFLHFSLWMSE